MKEVRWITRRQKLEALGLFVLGNSYSKRADVIVKELARVLGEDDSLGGHCGDAVYGSRSFDELLRLLNVKVKKGPDGLRKN